MLIIRDLLKNVKAHLEHFSSKSSGTCKAGCIVI